MSVFRQQCFDIVIGIIQQACQMALFNVKTSSVHLIEMLSIIHPDAVVFALKYHHAKIED